MTRWDQASEIYSLAEELGVSGDAPVSGILDYCHRRIDAWVVESGGVKNIDDLELLVTQKLQIVFEEIRTDDDWERIREVYARGKEGIRLRSDSDKVR